MTVTTTNVDVIYTTDGVVTEFPTTFQFLLNSHVKVQLNGVLLNSGYSVVGANDEDGGTVIFDTAPAAGEDDNLFIYRELPLTQDIAPINNSTIFGNVLGRGLDTTMMVLQQFGDAIARAIKVAPGAPLVDPQDVIDAAGLISTRAATDGSNISSPAAFRGSLNLAGSFVKDVGTNAAAFTAALATSALMVVATSGAYDLNAGFNVPAGTTLIIEPSTFGGAALESSTLSPGASIEIHNGGSDKLTRYFGKRLTGTYTPGAGLVGSFTSAYMFDIFSDDRDVGFDFSEGFRVRHQRGGSAAKGGCNAMSASLFLTAPTALTNTNSNFAAFQSRATANSHDNGSPGSERGALFGAGLAAYLAAGATNFLDATGVEINLFTKTGSSAKYMKGASIVTNQEVRGTLLDAMLTMSGQSSNGGYGPHIGNKHGIAFTNVSGADPFYSASILIGHYWTGGGTKAVATGIDLSGFTFSDTMMKGVELRVTETKITLGSTASVSELAASGSGGNADLLLSPIGSGLVRFGSHAAIGGQTVTGYISVKDAAGTERRLAVVS